jgi:hypothetical protein
MQLSKIFDGRTPFITNVTVFSATAIVEGAMLVSGASTTAQGAAVTVGLDTTDGLNFIGVTQVGSSLATQSKENGAPNSHAFNIPTSGFPNTGTAGTGGPTAKPLSYLPLCINVDASYYGLYSTTTGSGTASDTVGTWTAGTTTAVQRGTTGTDVLGGWLFSLSGVNSAGTTPTFSGSLRYISNQSATTHVTLVTAMNVSTDSHMVWVDRTFKKAGVLNSTADKLRSTSGSSGTGFKLNGTHMTAIENFVHADNKPYQPLRSWVHDGLNGLTGVQLYSELVFTQPFFSDVA